MARAVALLLCARPALAMRCRPTTRRGSGCARRRPWRGAAGRSPAGSARPACSRCCSTTCRAPRWPSHYAQQFVVAAVMLAVQLALTAASVADADRCRRWRCWSLGGLLSVRWARRGVLERDRDQRDGGRQHQLGLPAPRRAQGRAGARQPWRAFLDEYRRSLDARRGADRPFHARLIRHRGSWPPSARRSPPRVLLFVGVRLLALPFPVLIASLVLFARMSAPAQQLQLAAQNIGRAVRRRSRRSSGGSAGSSRCRSRRSPREPLEWNELGSTDAGFEHEPGLGLQGAFADLGARRMDRPGRRVGRGQDDAGRPRRRAARAASGRDRGRRRAARRAQTLDRLARGARLCRPGRVGVQRQRARQSAGRRRARPTSERCGDVLELVGLADAGRAPCRAGSTRASAIAAASLSGGERQRLVLARALLRGTEPADPRRSDRGRSMPRARRELLERLRALEPRPGRAGRRPPPSRRLAIAIRGLSHPTWDEEKSGELERFGRTEPPSARFTCVPVEGTMRSRVMMHNRQEECWCSAASRWPRRPAMRPWPPAQDQHDAEGLELRDQGRQARAQGAIA